MSIFRSFDLRDGLGGSTVAYPDEGGWDYQLNFYTLGGTVSFSGIPREGVEAMRDRLNLLLVETQP